ncbi:ADP-ribose pyrophosphatase, mitochondrial, partial [Orchesella cincta]
QSLSITSALNNFNFCPRTVIAANQSKLKLLVEHTTRSSHNHNSGCWAKCHFSSGTRVPYDYALNRGFHTFQQFDTRMTAKLAKTKIVIMDGVPYNNNSYAGMELRNLRNSLSPIYPFGGPARVPIPDDKIEWSSRWEDYSPPEFTTESILIGDKDWADKELRLTDVGLWPKWNQQDGGINRKSHHGNYRTDNDGYPLNPAGRTGIKGRGSLGRWATNHAADCIITRWKKHEDGSAVIIDGKPQLQFIGIIRKDTGDSAFPGGMIDAGEDAMTAVKREFLEEVFSSEEATDDERAALEDSLKNVFMRGETVYKGYVDDRRNTDNAWIETEAISFSLDELDTDVFSNLKFKAGSDATGALWIDIDQNVKLYASHKSIIKILIQKLNAYW